MTEHNKMNNYVRFYPLRSLISAHNYRSIELKIKTMYLTFNIVMKYVQALMYEHHRSLNICKQLKI